MFEFAEEVCFDGKALGNKSTWDKTMPRLLETPVAIVFASGV